MPVLSATRVACAGDARRRARSRRARQALDAANRWLTAPLSVPLDPFDRALGVAAELAREWAP